MKAARINPTPTLKAILYTKKVLSFELTANDYSLLTNLYILKISGNQKRG
jgi:hypothetical protein